MRVCRRSGHARLLLPGRRLAVLAVTLGMTATGLGMFPGTASASAASRSPGARYAAPGTGLTLARAPAGLRAAVHRTLGMPSGPAGRAAQQAKLTAPGTAEQGEFGWSVAVSGSTAVVSEPFGNSGDGAAYVFVRSGTTWTEQAKLAAADATEGGEFGSSVALLGSTAVVGAIGSGAAYVFVRSGTTWAQQAKLTYADSPRGGFGFSVAISPSTVVVGAPNKGSGLAFVFVRSGTTWAQQAMLTNPQPSHGSGFGYSVAVSGSTMVVGDPGKNLDTGAAFVYVRSGTAWAQQAKLTAANGAPYDELGTSAALSGSTAVLGADDANSGTGAAYVFVRSGTTWAQQAELTGTGVAVHGFFGYSVAISQSTVVVGAVSAKSATGAAYVFVRSGTSWAQRAKLTAADGTKHEGLGASVAVSGSTAVAGAPGQKSNTGAAYVFANV